MSIRAMNWARAICEQIGVPPGERLVLWAICLHHHDKTGHCFPAYETIAKATGYQRRKVIYAVDALEANGLVICQKRRANGHQGSNHFVLFGRPKWAKWRSTRVHDTTPCESAPQCTLPRVHPSAPDKEDTSYLSKAPTKGHGGNVIAMHRRSGHA
jgi:hypothetical protein